LVARDDIANVLPWPTVGSNRPDPLPRTGARVMLRRLAPADLENFQDYRRDPAVARYQGWSPMPDPEAAAFLEQMRSAAPFEPGTWLQLGIAERGSGALIGDIGVCVARGGEQAEIGFTLSPKSRRRGLATEAVRTAIGLLFDHTGVARIVAVTDARNLPSVRLLERVGMHRTGTANATFRGEACVEHSFAIARHDGG
jgi:RimJ/RimL family protein N-acetyltransferase